MKRTERRSRLFTILVLTVLFMLAVAGQAGAASMSRSITLTQGSTTKLKIKGAKKISWKSSKKKVATVNKKGKVKAVGAGTAVITAKAGKHKLTCKVTVLSKRASGSVNGSGNGGKVNTSTAGMSKKEAEVFKAMLAMKDDYPEGKKWTNKNYYAWNGGIYKGGYGCAAFAFLLSDAAFGDAPTTIHKKADKIRVGDILRVDDNTHSVIVLRVSKKGIVVAEGNYNSSIHWGREISNKELASTLDFVMTRYE